MQVRQNLVLEQVSLQLIGNQDVDQISTLGCFRSGDGLEVVADGQIVVGSTGALPDDDIAAAVAQVLRLSMSLASIADNGDCFVLEQREIRVIVVINFGSHETSLGS